MQEANTNEKSDAAAEMEWAFDHWYKLYMDEDIEQRRRSLLLAIVTSVLAIAVNAGAVEISQSDVAGFSIAPKSAIAIGAILTASSIGTFLSVLLTVSFHYPDDLAISWFAQHGVKRAQALSAYRKKMSENTLLGALGKVIAGLFAVVFLLGPIASIVTFVLSIREVF